MRNHDAKNVVSERAFLERHVSSLGRQLCEAYEEHARLTAQALLAATGDEALHAEREIAKLKARMEELRDSLTAETARLRWLAE